MRVIEASPPGEWRFDLTPYLDYYNGALGTASDGPLFVNSGGESTGDSVELRLASDDNDRFEWLVGAMVFDTDKDLYEQLGAPGFAAELDASTDPRFGPGTGAVVSPDGDVFNAFYSKVTGTEQALFGEASFHLSPQWTLAQGGRAFKTRVRVVDTNSLSLTLATDDGHPEAGRITFGVYPNDEGDIVFHIRSRARSGSKRFTLRLALTACLCSWLRGG